MKKLLLTTAAVLVLAGCSSLPQAPALQALYDFGPQPSFEQRQADPARTAIETQAPLVLAGIRTSGLPDGSTPIFYRLAYADAQQLRPYAQARWARPAAQLIQQSLYTQLSDGRAVLEGQSGVVRALATGANPAMLRLDVEEFSQVFSDTATSQGLLRLRATLTEVTPRGEKWLAQQVFTVQRPAPTPDAAGGTQALGAATEEAGRQIDAWLLRLGR
ncbi:MAG: ABC-type transport auxiliary lipoprotein family protein [Comamonas sp.]